MALTEALFSIKTPFEEAFSSNAVIILPVSSCPSNLLKIALGGYFFKAKRSVNHRKHIGIKNGEQQLIDGV